MKMLMFLKDSVITKSFGSKPKIVNFPITDNCDSKCVMCNVWEDRVEGELTPSEIKRILGFEYFQNVKHLGISGGEPTLRKDIVNCVEAILVSLKLESLSITSHGYHYKIWERIAPKIKRLAEKHNTQLSINISIDGIEKEHDFIRGTKDAYHKAIKTVEVLTSQGIPVQLQCTVSKSNLFSTSEVLSKAQELGVDCIFRVATTIERLYNKGVVQRVELSADEKSFLADFFLSDFLHDNTKSVSRGIYYEEMAKNLTGRKGRNMPCYFQKEGVLLSSKGEIAPCSVTGKVIADLTEISFGNEYTVNDKEINIRVNNTIEDCDSCIHDQSGKWGVQRVLAYYFTRRASVFNKFYNLGTKALNSLPKLAYVLTHKPKQIKIEKDAIHEILILGAYGGEHVGDAGILGGVIIRSKQRYPNLKKVTVSTFRKDRTERWLNALDLPVAVECLVDKEVINKHLQVDLIVYGGGPLMELPLHLLNHLYVATKSNLKKIPFSLEGVGVGPIKTKISRYLIGRLFDLSSYSRVRTRKAKSDVYEMYGKNVELETDPAFDYLATRSFLTKVSKRELNSFEQMIDKKSAKKLVAINLRPLWSKYSFGRDINIENVEKKYITNLAKACKGISEKENVEFIFFAMNADQFGMSDFLTANKLKAQMIKEGVLLNIWKEEPGIDGLILLLNQVDCVISMRFHGCIFALSQRINNVISIDYQIGRDGKVSDIMDDKGCSENKFRVDELSSNDLIDRVLCILSMDDRDTKDLTVLTK